jgi:hypothetical protein
MQKPTNKLRNLTILTNTLSELAAEIPAAVIAFGVFANFAWVIGLFWLLSYWIAWH